jgi:hypothetical protein
MFTHKGHLRWRLRSLRLLKNPLRFIAFLLSMWAEVAMRGQQRSHP